jgi:hypothetical protein
MLDLNGDHSPAADGRGSTAGSGVSVSQSSAAQSDASALKPAMGVFERFLTLRVALCIVAGIALSQLVPPVFHVLGEATVAQVNIPVAALVWLMIVPMLLKIVPAPLREFGQHRRGIASPVGINWLVEPFSMSLLAWIFIAHGSAPGCPRLRSAATRGPDPVGRGPGQRPAVEMVIRRWVAPGVIAGVAVKWSRRPVRAPRVRSW